MGTQEQKLAQQLETGCGLAWLAYREKLPELDLPLEGGVKMRKCLSLRLAACYDEFLTRETFGILPLKS